MPLRRWLERSAAQAGAPALRALEVSMSGWPDLAQDVAASGGRLLALWGSAPETDRCVVRAVYLLEGLGLVASVTFAPDAGALPGLESYFPAASRQQRAMRDLLGIRSSDPDERPWLRHSSWPAAYKPLLADRKPPPAPEPTADRYDFVRVDGEGVHEVPVGPVHAGIIEPGHFRFSVVGEKVLRLEERLGYVHKGIERRFSELPLLQGHRLAARISGDSAVAYSWAYCQALEGICGVVPPARAAWLRALCLELERVANHLGDLGALGNDAGFAFGLSQFSRLKEQLLRTVQQQLGARYLMDAIVPGGVALPCATTGLGLLLQCADDIAGQVLLIRDIYDEHSGMRDRFNDTGRVVPELAARLGLTGLAGRASGQAFDLRCDLPCEPYAQLAPALCKHTAGDVAARVAIRFDEVQQSCTLIQRIARALPEGPEKVEVRAPDSSGIGIGMIEGWRGPVLVGLEAGDSGDIRRCHPHDPSWQNWPVLEHAVIGNIVPDFPLINKSFNLSYSGHDL